MRKIKIIPFIISILFPLVCTAFIVCYSYGVNDTYTTNKVRFDNYVLEDYYDEYGQAKDEIVKAVQMDSNKFQIVTSISESHLKGDLVAYTTDVETTDEEGNVETSTEIAYSLYLYDIVYNKIKKPSVEEFENKNNNNVYLKNGATLALVYVKGIGSSADELLEESLEELKTKGSTSSGTYVSASKVDINDNNAQNYNTTEEDTAKAYRVSLFNSLNTDFYDFSDLSLIYADAIENGEVIGEDIKEGYTLALVNYYSSGSHSVAIKVISEFQIEKVYDAETFEANEGVTEGYAKDYAKAGYSYFKFVFPTLLWQGALTLVLTGILAVLFYAIWQVEETETEEQKRIKKLQAAKKQAKKSKK